MIFNKTGRLIRENLYLNGTKLENVRMYKYLGFLFTPSGEVRTGLLDLRDRALKAFMKLRNHLGNHFNESIPITINLIESLIIPILMYSSDFWGSLSPPKYNPIDILHTSILKQTLGVQKQTSNLGVFLELGKSPIQIEAKKRVNKNWERIRSKQANNHTLSRLKQGTSNQSR